MLLLQYGYSSLPKAQKAEDYVNQYIQGEGIPSRTLNIDESDEDFFDNMKIIGIVLIILLFISSLSNILISYFTHKNYEAQIEQG